MVTVTAHQEEQLPLQKPATNGEKEGKQKHSLGCPKFAKS